MLLALLLTPVTLVLLGLCAIESRRVPVRR
jgi:hypothetical protein